MKEEIHYWFNSSLKPKFLYLNLKLKKLITHYFFKFKKNLLSFLKREKIKTEKLKKQIISGKIIPIIFNYSEIIYFFQDQKEKIIFIDTKNWQIEVKELDIKKKYCILNCVDEKNKYFEFMKSLKYKVKKINLIK